MSTLSSIINIIFLFFGISMVIFLGIAVTNIATKSYRPQRSLWVLSIFIILFFTTGFLTFASLNNFINLSGDNDGFELRGGDFVPTDNGSSLF